jgi:CheY-like chemotaxis protein
VAEAVDGKDAIDKAAATKPDVAVLDCMMPRLGGAEATRQIRARLPNTEVLIFTAHDDERLIDHLLRAGARGYILKSDAPDQLLEAVQSVSEHKPFFTDRQRDLPHPSGTNAGPTDRRRTYEQGSRRDPGYPSEGSREPANRDYEKAQIGIVSGPGPLRHSQRACRILSELNSQRASSRDETGGGPE